MKTTFDRRICLGYTLAGFVCGAVVAAYLFGGRTSQFFKHTDGSITKSRFHQESWTDEGTWATYTVTIPSGRPLPLWDRAWMIAGDGYDLLVGGALLGLCWAFVRLQVRAWLDCPFGDDQALDYEDSTARKWSPGST